MFIAVYVDDLTIVCKDKVLISKIKQDLSERFKMTDLGEIHHLLQIKITRDRKNKLTFLNQTKYINSLVKLYGLENAGPVESPQAVTIRIVCMG